MRPEDVFFDGVTSIREELIEEAQRYVFRRRIRWQRYAALAAACLALVLGLNFLSTFGGLGGGSSGSSSADSGGAASNDAAPAPDEPQEPETAMPSGERSLTADVLEFNADGSLLVVPQPGSGIWSVADRVIVPTYDVWEMPDVQPGDRVLIVYTGEAGDNFVNGVTEIRILD